MKLFELVWMIYRMCRSAPYCRWDLSFVTESSVIVIKLDKELVRIECRKEEKPDCSGRYRLEEAPGCKVLLKATVYDETLISVAECLG